MNELNDLNFQCAFLVTERFNRRFHTRNIPVVIRAPYIDELVESAVKFVFMVCDIRQQISV